MGRWIPNPEETSREAAAIRVASPSRAIRATARGYTFPATKQSGKFSRCDHRGPRGATAVSTLTPRFKGSTKSATPKPFCKIAGLLRWCNREAGSRPVTRTRFSMLTIENRPWAAKVAAAAANIEAKKPATVTIQRKRATVPDRSIPTIPTVPSAHCHLHRQRCGKNEVDLIEQERHAKTKREPSQASPPTTPR